MAWFFIPHRQPSIRPRTHGPTDLNNRNIDEIEVRDKQTIFILSLLLLFLGFFSTIPSITECYQETFKFIAVSNLVYTSIFVSSLAFIKRQF